MDKCTICIKDLLELILAHSKILLRLKDIYLRYTKYSSQSTANSSININLSNIAKEKDKEYISTSSLLSGVGICNLNTQHHQTSPNLIQIDLINASNSGLNLNSMHNNIANIISSSNCNCISNNTINNFSSSGTHNNINNSSVANVNNSLFLSRRNSQVFHGTSHANQQSSNLQSGFGSSCQVFDEEEYLEIIEESEKLCAHSEEILNFYANVEFLVFSFYEIISQAYEDIVTLKSLFCAYLSLLNLDAINSISNMLCARRNIENLKMKFSISNKSFYDLKLYLFYIQFFLDNSSKINFLFKTYFENKKNQLLSNIQSSSFINEFKIKDELFCFKSQQYCDRYIKKYNDENIEVSYFMILFEKKKFLDFPETDNRKLTIRNFYLSKSQMFIDNDDDIGLITLFHTNGDSYKNILNEISLNYKSSNLDSKFQFSTKTKINFYKLFLHSISNHIFVAIKYKEKSSQESTAIAEICKDLRYRFTDMHIFKTLFL